MLELQDLELDGFEALKSLVEASDYGSIQQAIASLTVFSHPETVAQTGAKAIFLIVRDLKRRGKVAEVNGRLIGFDDNTSPTEALCWANDWTKRPRDLQFNHVYTRSSDPDCYTNLANICVSPSFLAKLTDTDPYIQSLLRYQAFDLFGWLPIEPQELIRPSNYENLIWAKPLLPRYYVVERLKRQIANRTNRTTRIIKQTGWLFEETKD